MLLFPESELSDLVVELAGSSGAGAHALVALLVLADNLHVQRAVLFEHLAVFAAQHLDLRNKAWVVASACACAGCKLGDGDGDGHGGCVKACNLKTRLSQQGGFQCCKRQQHSR
jgi:hypothetical protein